MQYPFRYFNSSPEVIRLTVMMYIRYPLSLRQVEDLLLKLVSIFATRQYVSGGTGSARCSQRRSGSGAFITGHIPDGDGTWMKCLCGSTARRITCGVPWITKARCSKFLPRNAGIARLR
jgi:hypothetical protein